MNYNNIAELFINTTESFASKKLYYYKSGTEWIGITGTDIREEVENLASGLKSLGLQKGQKVAIQSTNSPRWCMTDYSIICSGCTTVTLYPTLIPNQMNYILDNSETQIFFVENQEQLQKFKEISSSLTRISSVIVMDDSFTDTESQIINYSDLLKTGAEYKKFKSFSIIENANSINENDLLTLIYTSGTTGNPKGVMLTHSNLIANITAILQAAKLSQDDNETFLSFLPFLTEPVIFRSAFSKSAESTSPRIIRRYMVVMLWKGP